MMRGEFHRGSAAGDVLMKWEVQRAGVLSGYGDA